ncbi:MAG: rRNA pseudouridine synthase [Bacteroidales bacterium]|nr:rRNA pseudouridine synthase [Bacteroidales bacterium]
MEKNLKSRERKNTRDNRRDNRREVKRDDRRDNRRDDKRDGKFVREKGRGRNFVESKRVKAPKLTDADAPIRLNRFIANCGICSRREADELIAAGVVSVNGKVVTELGTKVNRSDEVRFNGRRLQGEHKVYIVMNKPKDYVTSLSDSHAEHLVTDLISKELCPERVYPVGRLDKSTTGVLLLTNDGELSQMLTHPSFQRRKIYEVTLATNLREEDYDKLMSGVELEDGTVAADRLEYVGEKKNDLGIEIHSGKNRVVRRMFEALGYKVRKLDRVYFAGITKKNLRRGQWRFLTEAEINILRINPQN